MNNSIKRTIIILGIVILFVTSFILLLVGKSDYSSNIPQEKKYVKKSDFSLFNYSEKIDTAKIKETFPYDDYLKIANINHPASIIKDLADLDSVQPFNMTLNEDILIDALTKKLAERNKNIYNEYNPDTLISLFQWTEKFESYSIMNSQRKVFFNIIYDYWMNFIANKLAKLYDSQPALIYDYKFKYLVSRCQEKKYNVSIKVSNLEKIAINIGENNWAYLYNKFWNNTGLVFKIFLLLFAVFLIMPYPYIIILRSKIKKQ